MDDHGYTLDRPMALTCPECGGATRREVKGSFVQYRCHIGHILSAETMLAAQFAALEKLIGGCLALLNERAELCRQMANMAQTGQVQTFESAREEALERAKVIGDMLESEWIAPVFGKPAL